MNTAMVMATVTATRSASRPSTPRSTGPRRVSWSPTCRPRTTPRPRRSPRSSSGPAPTCCCSTSSTTCRATSRSTCSVTTTSRFRSNGAQPIHYPYAFVAPSNTGIPSGFDLDNSGTIGGGNDAYGFGDFPGQFGMAVLEPYPIDYGKVRTFQNFLWKDMPGAMLPDDPNDGGAGRLVLPGRARPLPALQQVALGPAGPDRPARRCTSWSRTRRRPPSTGRGPQRHPQPRRDPVLGRLRRRARTDIYDDRGDRGGLRHGESFVIAGDQNSDPRRRRLRGRLRSSSCSTTRASRTRCPPRPVAAEAAIRRAAPTRPTWATRSTTPRTSTTTPRPATCGPTTCCRQAAEGDAAPASSGRCPPTRCPA